MKVLFVNTYAGVGGAAVACRRLMETMGKRGVEVRMLVCRDSVSTDRILPVNRSWWQRKAAFFRFVWERFVIFIHNRLSRKNLFAVSIANTGTSISKHPAVLEADVIHLHWINQGFLSLGGLDDLLATGKPIVWTMHDMWPMTGICHHARDCSRFEQQCGCCFFLNSRNENDLSVRIFRRKSRLPLSRIRFVGCSRWLVARARKSALLRQMSVVDIPNPIDLVFWKKQTPAECRRRFSLPGDRKLILFAAVKPTDRRKGIDYLIDSLKIYADRHPEECDQIGLVVMGHWDLQLNENFVYPVYSIGYLSDEKQIRDLYSAVDLFVIPSLEENLPNTIMEAMACECPSVGFDVGGIPEMIDSGVTGYVARYRSAEDFSDGIYRVFHSDYRQMGLAARKKAERFYSDRIVGDRYYSLYEQLLEKENE